MRTGPPDGPKHQGITWLIMPMDTPGVGLRPLMTVGGSTEFSEMILEDVRIPWRTGSAPRATAGGSRW